MKIKEISKKIMSSFLVFAVMLMPAMVFASEGETHPLDVETNETQVNEVKNETENEIKNEVEADENNVVEDKNNVIENQIEDDNNKEDEYHELDDDKDKKDEEEKKIKASEIKLLDKIKFSGTLYKLVKTDSEKGKYTDQEALVTNIIKRDDGMIGVTFVQENHILSTSGYIKVEECEKLEITGKLISFKFSLGEDESGKIEINEKAYEINEKSIIKLANGGIQIDDEFVQLKEGDVIKLVDLNGSFGLENSSNKMIERLVINGNATFKITKNGFIVSGDAVVNGETFEGEIEVTFEGEKVSVELINAEIDGKQLRENNLKSIIKNIINKIVDFIKGLFSKLFGKD